MGLPSHVIVHQVFTQVVRRMKRHIQALSKRRELYQSKLDAPCRENNQTTTPQLTEGSISASTPPRSIVQGSALSHVNTVSDNPLRERSMRQLLHLRRLHGAFHVYYGMPEWARQLFQVSKKKTTIRLLNRRIQLARASQRRSAYEHFFTRAYRKSKQDVRPSELVREFHRLHALRCPGQPTLHYQCALVKEYLRRTGDLQAGSPMHSPEWCDGNLWRTLQSAHRSVAIRKTAEKWKYLSSGKDFRYQQLHLTHRISRYAHAVGVRCRHLKGMRSASQRISLPTNGNSQSNQYGYEAVW
ncbi:importin beta-1 subunit [Perkinsela sp. CCAP 1560/4]|nr:importin beta-1 subunit [Perkinsela sp. CCAP 1560/4]|eukprot:KNH06322.1 importin beta-1 subunit [Perkinsela sp. CCAP 1560/4]